VFSPSVPNAIRVSDLPITIVNRDSKSSFTIPLHSSWVVLTHNVTGNNTLINITMPSVLRGNNLFSILVPFASFVDSTTQLGSREFGNYDWDFWISGFVRVMLAVQSACRSSHSA